MKTDGVRVGIIGTGGRGRGIGKLLEKCEGVKIAALCDSNHVRLQEVANYFEGEQTPYASVEEMLEKEQLDAAIVTTPDCFHEPHAVAALEHGVNIFVDKPLATTAKGCRNIITAAEKSKKTVMIGFNMRHVATVKRLKKIVDDGILGEIFLIENREFYTGGRTYMARWNRKYEISGGLWVHKGCHDFDVFNWLLGFPKPVKVSAFAGVNVLNPEHIPFEPKPGVEPGPACHQCAYKDTCPDVFDISERPEWLGEATKVDDYFKDRCIYMSDKDVHDNGIAIVEYENGARASHLECFVTPISDRLYTVVGDKGQAEVSVHKRSIVIRPRWTRDTITYEVSEETGGHGGSDPGVVGTFVRVIKGDTPNTSTAEHGLWATVIGEAAEISRREERVVRIDELME